MNLNEISEKSSWYLEQNGLEKEISVILEGNENATRGSVQSTLIFIFTANFVEMIPAFLW